VSASTRSRLRSKGLRILLLAAAVLAGAGTSRLAAAVEEPDAGQAGTPYGALPVKDPQTGQVVGHYCTGVHCYNSTTASKYHFCCIL
jgi:hypothetical protein